MKRFKTIIAVLTVSLLFFGCLSAPSVPEDLYSGMGRDASLLRAMSAAKMDAVKNAVIDLIGPGAEQANSELLSDVLYSTNNPNAYVLKDTMNTLVKDKNGEDYLYEIEIRVNMDAVNSVLRANGINGNSAQAAVEPEAQPEASVPAAQTVVSAETESEPEPELLSVEATADDWGEITAEEARLIRRYVSTMTYMVYFNDENNVDPALMRRAVATANEYMASNALEVIDLDQVERVKESQRMAYEELTGQELSLMQWIAQELNADVYIEIDAEVRGETEGSRYYGTANLVLKMFEASTGRLLGSVPYTTPNRAVNRNSEFDAITNAVQSSVYAVMPVIVEQSRNYMTQALSRGIKYELIIENTYDGRVMSSFRRKLSARVKWMETISSTSEETRYNVYIIGVIEDLEDLIYDISETVPGLEGIMRVYQRGKSITFDSGM